MWTVRILLYSDVMGEFHNIGAALKILRNRIKMKQREVGEKAGVTPAMISTYETGKAIPLIPTVESLLDAMGYDRFDLINALEEANGRPKRTFPEEDSEDPGVDVLETLGADGLPEEEREAFLEALTAVSKLLMLARRSSAAAAGSS